MRGLPFEAGPLEICRFFEGRYLSEIEKSLEEINWVGGWVGWDSFFLKLGWSSDKTIWFSGLEVSENGILVCKDFNGRPSGEAYVQFNSVVEAEKAIEKNNANMGHRWGPLQYLIISFRVGREVGVGPWGEFGKKHTK